MDTHICMYEYISHLVMCKLGSATNMFFIVPTAEENDNSSSEWKHDNHGDNSILVLSACQVSLHNNVIVS